MHAWIINFTCSQQNYFMKTRPKSAKSAFEVSFQRKQTFQRNKEFINLDKASHHEREYSALRRKPLKSEDNHISEKINSSFMNTTAELTERAYKNIFKHKSKSRNSFQTNSPSVIHDDLTAQQISPSKRGKSFSIEKMTSREYHHRLRNKVVPDERRFNNFEKFTPGTPLYCDYDKMLNQKEVIDKPYLNLQYNTQKLYEDYYYKRTTNNCRVDYKSEKKLQSERVFFTPRNPDLIAATTLDLEKVDNGFKIATNFKDGNITKGNIDQFYRNSGRLPSQMDMRRMNEMTNHWVDESGKIQRKKLDFERRKMKQDLQNQRMRKIKYSKQAKNQRAQMCDTKYFRIFHP